MRYTKGRRCPNPCRFGSETANPFRTRSLTTFHFATGKNTPQPSKSKLSTAYRQLPATSRRKIFFLLPLEPLNCLFYDTNTAPFAKCKNNLTVIFVLRTYAIYAFKTTQGPDPLHSPHGQGSIDLGWHEQHKKLADGCFQKRFAQSCGVLSLGISWLDFTSSRPD